MVAVCQLSLPLFHNFLPHGCLGQKKKKNQSSENSSRLPLYEEPNTAFFFFLAKS